MTFTMTYRGADGAPVSEAVERLRSCGWASDFFGFDISKNVVAKHSGTTKELLLGTGQRNIDAKLEFDQVQGADEVGELKQAVAVWLNVFCELNRAIDFGFEDLMEHSCDRCLATVVVDFDTLKRCDKVTILRYEILERGFEAGDNLFRGINEFLIHAQAMISVLYLAGECHHARKYASTQLSAQHGVVLLAANERPCVEAMSLKADFAVGTLKAGDVFRYVNGLVVEHHADDVETGFSVGEAKIARLVHEYAQCFCAHAGLAQKREWRDTNPATHAESFPRIPVTPPPREKSPRIIANDGIECKRVFSFKEAA